MYTMFCLSNNSQDFLHKNVNRVNENLETRIAKQLVHALRNERNFNDR